MTQPVPGWERQHTKYNGRLERFASALLGSCLGNGHDAARVETMRALFPGIDERSSALFDRYCREWEAHPNA